MTDDADRALVATAVERYRRLAREAGDDGDPAEVLYYDGIADLIELCDIPGAAAFIRERSLRALKGGASWREEIPDRARPGGGASKEEWLQRWWLTHRTRRAREALNHERARVGLPPIVRNLMALNWDGD